MSGFGRILEDLNEASVAYVLVCGIAMIRHGVVRATRDIAAVFDPTVENVERILGLVDKWGFPRRSARLPILSPSCARPEENAISPTLADLQAAHGELPTAGS